MYSQNIEGDNYDVFRYYIPTRADSKLNSIRKWFRVMGREHVPQQYKRRKQPIEHVETAVMILGRIDQLYSLDVPLTVGSGFLSSKPWATFGNVSSDSKIEFKNFDSIIDHYKSQIVKGAPSAGYFHFRIVPSLAEHLADKYNQTDHTIVSLATLFLYDLLINTGPDCEELYDLFTNDTRIGPDHIDVKEWRDLRKTVFGKKGKTKDKRYNLSVGQVNEPITLVSRTDFEERPESDDLTEGEKIVQIKYKMTYEEIDSIDDGNKSLEEDYNYACSVKDRVKKYSHLGLGINPSCYE